MKTFFSHKNNIGADIGFIVGQWVVLLELWLFCLKLLCLSIAMLDSEHDFTCFSDNAADVGKFYSAV